MNRLFLLCLALACGTGARRDATSVNPIASSVSPTSVLLGAQALTLAVHGADFISGCVVRVNGVDRPTTFLDASQVQAAIPASDLAVAARLQIVVVNPGGDASSAAEFDVEAPTPILAAATPGTVLTLPSVCVGSCDYQQLTVTGLNFVAASVVLWDGSALPTTLVTSSQLTAILPFTLVSGTGPHAVKVTNPAPGGGTTAAATIQAQNPRPGLSTVTPASVPAGSGPLTLTAGGFAFFPGATVRFNGIADRPTAFVDQFHLATQLSCADLIGPALGTMPSILLFVANPAPAEAQSFGVTLTVQPRGASVFAAASVTGDGTYAGGFIPALSASGRYVAFASSDALTGGHASGNVFLRDSCQGAPAGCTPGAVLVSAALDGSPLFGSFRQSPLAITPDGRFVAFGTDASNLVQGDTNGANDAFVRDTCTGAPAGCVPSIQRVSLANDGSEGNGASTPMAMSSDARFVAFYSDATNLVAGDTNGATDVFVRDTCRGAAACVPSTVRVSVATDGTQGNGVSGVSGVSPDFGATSIAMSASGRFVAFLSSATNLVASPGGSVDAIVRDTCQGAPAGCTPSTTRVSPGSDGIVGSLAVTSELAISADGRYVALQLSGGIHLRDTCIGAPAGCVPSTTAVSVANDGSFADIGAFGISMSADARFISFTSAARNLDLCKTTNTDQEEAYVRDTCIGAPAGCVPSTTLVSAGDSGVRPDQTIDKPSISPDGHVMAFATRSTTLLPGGNPNGASGVLLAHTGF